MLAYEIMLPEKKRTYRFRREKKGRYYTIFGRKNVF